MNPEELEKQIEERIKTLPPVLQDAIASADIEQHMRTLSSQYKLHLDQWDILENEVMMTLIGLQPTQDLAQNIAREVGVDATLAHSIAADISRIVFDPVRKELESLIEQGTQSATTPPVNTVPTVVTPAPLVTVPDALTIKVERGEVHPNYTDNASHERKDIVGDPYREQP
jgi:hypothetical protein